MIDDTGLFHGDYDPTYAREYYLRTRKLKGRKKGFSTSSVSSPRPSKMKTGAVQVHQGQKAPLSKQAKLRQQKEALQKRLEVLRDALSQLVEAAQARSGVQKNTAEKKTAETKAKTSTSTKKTSSSKDKPETAAQKKERAKKAKEEYEKKNPGSLSQDVEILQAQIEDIKAKIAKALKDAQSKQKPKAQIKSAGSKNAALVRPRNDNPSGPRGR